MKPTDRGISRLRKVATALATAALFALLLAGTPSNAAMLDPSFGAGGVSFISPGVRIGSAHGLTIDPSGRVIVVGRSNEPSNQFYAARFAPDGSPDTSFGVGGLAITDFSGYDGNVATASALIVQRSGKIIVTGRYKRAGGRLKDNSIALARFNPEGSVDLPFSDKFGSWKLDDQGYTSLAMAQGRGGKFLVAGSGQNTAGWSDDYGLVSRYDAEGNLDPTFNAGGHSLKPGHVVMSAPINQSINLQDMILIGRGRILVAGEYARRSMVARLGRDGRPDRSFGRRGFTIDGIDRVRTCDHRAPVNGMARTSHGKILAAGYCHVPGLSNDYLTVTRFRANGKLDRTFGRKGIARLRLAKGVCGADIAVQRDGRIVVVGQSGDRLAVVRFTPDGHLDRTFFHDGLYLNPSLGASFSPVGRKVLIDRAGRIVVAGGDDYRGYAFVMRILPNAGR